MEDTLIKHPNIANYRLCGGFDIPEEKMFRVNIFHLDEFDSRNYEEIIAHPDSSNI